MQFQAIVFSVVTILKLVSFAGRTFSLSFTSGAFCAASRLCTRVWLCCPVSASELSTRAFEGPARVGANKKICDQSSSRQTRRPRIELRAQFCTRGEPTAKTETESRSLKWQYILNMCTTTENILIRSQRMHNIFLPCGPCLKK